MKNARLKNNTTHDLVSVTIMDNERDSGNSYLLSEIHTRRRQNSFTDDYSVQKTNDDATECKYVAVKKKYWDDPYISKFVSHQVDSNLIRRDPEILRGYWARVTGIRSLICNFIKKAGPTCQIINLGAGFDTNYWWLKKFTELKFASFVEFDFSSVTSKKIRFIRKPGNNTLTELFSEKITECQHNDLYAGDYKLCGADLRQHDEFMGKLEKAKLNKDAPTLIIAECVLVYMKPEKSEELIRSLSEYFKVISFINYEQVCLNDNFGQVMIHNLNQRGITLDGLSSCNSIQDQVDRFKKNGFNEVSIWKMNEVYSKYLPEQERKAIESLEMLDENELLVQLLEHYCIVYSSKCDSQFEGNFKSLSEITIS
ncbi:Leucine carboxyl methyltransferase 1 [Strongyloides ratti]|uniref:Leucine carboxyl methyltransferase 1 n=1 Tax=Strongyloides ratti TaxID=34506 RepID=A0A090MZS9_STRRB|nr:Leucine carboxyl methyltransferase 1 [Strongyloides ratti]CEF69464.1 Leucine carboxyl methyltransferase 1 [Strongyloides ratti]